MTIVKADSRGIVRHLRMQVRDPFREVLRQGNSIATCRCSRFFEIVCRGEATRYSIYREIV